MIQHRGLIAHCSVARVLEEIYRLLREGSARAAFEQMHHLGILQVLFPEIAALLPPSDIAEACTPVPAVRAGRRRRKSTARPDQQAADEQTDAPKLQVDGPGPEQETEPPPRQHLDGSQARSTPRAEPEAPAVDEHAAALALLEHLELTEPNNKNEAVQQLWALLAGLDSLVRESKRTPSEPLLLGTLLSPLAVTALREDKRIGETVEQVELLVQSVAKRIHVSKRHRDRLKHVLVGQRRLTHRRRANVHRRDYFEEALQLLRLRCEAMGKPPPSAQELKEHAPQKKRRRRRRRRPTGAPAQEASPLSADSGS
jgi:tRNA nucleotidyltransferase/poly(A) polymerase